MRTLREVRGIFRPSENATNSPNGSQQRKLYIRAIVTNNRSYTSRAKGEIVVVNCCEIKCVVEDVRRNRAMQEAKEKDSARIARRLLRRARVSARVFVVVVAVVVVVVVLRVRVCVYAWLCACVHAKRKIKAVAAETAQVFLFAPFRYSAARSPVSLCD